MTSVESDREICPKGTSQKEVDHVGAVLTDQHPFKELLYWRPTTSANSPHNNTWASELQSVPPSLSQR